MSRWARAMIHLETELSAGDVESLADVVYSWDEQTAAISSGSFRLDGMVIAFQNRRGGRAERVDARGEVEQRPVAEAEPGADRRLVAAVLYGKGRLSISHPVCFGEEG